MVSQARRVKGLVAKVVCVTWGGTWRREFGPIGDTPARQPLTDLQDLAVPNCLSAFGSRHELS